MMSLPLARSSANHSFPIIKTTTVLLVFTTVGAKEPPWGIWGNLPELVGGQARLVPRHDVVMLMHDDTELLWVKERAC